MYIEDNVLVVFASYKGSMCSRREPPFVVMRTTASIFNREIGLSGVMQGGKGRLHGHD